MCALDHDDLAHLGRGKALEHGGKEDELLGRAVAGRRTGREDDGGDHGQVSLTVAFSIAITCVGCSSSPPSWPIASTTSIPWVTVPMIA